MFFIILDIIISIFIILLDCLLNRVSSFDQIFILFVLEINFCLVNEYKYTSYWLNSKDFSFKLFTIL